MRERIRRRLASSIAVLLAVSWTLASPAPCSAQTDPDDLARRHFESGAAYFEQAEYEAALREFEKAYELSQRPQILRNISVVHERMGNLPAAVAALDQYLAAAPDDPDLDTIRIRRDNLSKHLKDKEEETPIVAPPPKEPEKREEPKEPANEPFSDDSGAEFGSDDFADDSEDGPNLVPAYVLITVGGLAAVGSAVTGYFASDEHSNLEATCGSRAAGCTDSELATGQTLALTSTVLTGVAVLGVGIGAILWATADSGSDSGSRSTQTARSHQTAGGATGRGRANGSVLPEVTLGAGPQGGFGEARWRF